MSRNRTVYLIAMLWLALASTGAALVDSTEDPIDLEAVKQASLVPVCAYMKQQKPHIRDWKKGELPTEKELKTLIRRHPDLADDLERIRTKFYREIESNPKKADAFRRKRKHINMPRPEPKRGKR